MASEEPTQQLIRRIRAGDSGARDALFARCLPLLRRWAHGRLPIYARDIGDTDDLVQITLIRALKHIEEFESSSRGSLLAYLRHILLNEVRAEIRKRGRRADKTNIDDVEVADPAPSAVEELVGQERMQVYESALASLSRDEQAMIVMRLEFDMSYQEIALETDSTADAVRMRVSRALKVIANRIAAMPE